MVAVIAGLLGLQTSLHPGPPAGTIATHTAVVTLVRQGKSAQTLPKNTTIQLFHGDQLKVKAGTATVVYNDNAKLDLSPEAGTTLIRRHWTSTETSIQNSWADKSKPAVRPKGGSSDPGFPDGRLIPAFLFAYVPTKHLIGDQVLSIKQDGNERFHTTVHGDGWFSSPELQDLLSQVEKRKPITLSVGSCLFTLPSKTEEADFKAKWVEWGKQHGPLRELGRASQLLSADLPEFALYELQVANKIDPVYPWAVEEEHRLLKAGVQPIRFVSSF